MEAPSAEQVNALHKASHGLEAHKIIEVSEDAGLRIYKKIREFKPEQKTIIISGFSESSYVKKALKLGVGSFTKKPYTVETLGKVVRDELDKNN